MLVRKGRSKQVYFFDEQAWQSGSDEKKVDVLNNSFASAFNGNLSSRWITKQELGRQSSSHNKKRLGL